MNGYEQLANAIIVQAVRDYETVFVRDHKHSTRETRRELKKLKSFFMSDEFAIYTNADPVIILCTVEQRLAECDYNVKKYRRLIKIY